MMIRRAASLAWKILYHNPDRMVRSVLGISFAILLMVVQLGFRNAFLDSSILFLRILNADVLVIGSHKSSFLERGTMHRDRLYQSQSVPGVREAYPLYLHAVPWKNPEDGTLRPIRVLGFILDQPVFLSEEIENQAHMLRRPGTALIDRASKGYYGPIGPGPAEAGGTTIEVVGTFQMGTDFELDGTIIVGEETFLGMSSDLGFRSIQLVLVQLEEAADPDTVTDALNRALPRDVTAYRKDALIARELDHWNRATPVGILFMAGTAVGFVAGIVILTQILFTLISDHLNEFATLKAIGYRESYLVAVVLLMAFFLSVIGLVLSLVVGLGIYELLASLTGLPLALTLPRTLIIVALSTALCATAGLLALRRVLTVDPAEVFR